MAFFAGLVIFAGILLLMGMGIYLSVAWYDTKGDSQLVNQLFTIFLFIVCIGVFLICLGFHVFYRIRVEKLYPEVSSVEEYIVKTERQGVQTERKVRTDSRP